MWGKDSKEKRLRIINIFILPQIPRDFMLKYI